MHALAKQEHLFSLYLLAPGLAAVGMLCFFDPLTSLAVTLAFFCVVIGYFYYPLLIILVIIGLYPMDVFQMLSETNPMFSLIKIIFPPLFILVLWKKAVMHERFITHRQFRLVFLLFLTIIASFLFCKSTLWGFHSTRKYISMMAFYFCIIQLIQSRRDIYAILITIAASCVISGASGIIEKFTSIIIIGQSFGTYEAKRLVGASTYDPNTYAAYMMVGFFICLSFLVHKKNLYMRVLASVCALVLLYSIIFSYSRGSSIAFFVGLVAFFIVHRKSLNYPLLLFLIPAISLLAWLFIPVDYWERLQTLASIGSDESLSRRASYHIIGLRLFKEHFLLGVGPGNFPIYYPLQENRFLTTTIIGTRFLHNMYLSILAELGLLGFISFGLIIATSINNLFQLKKQLIGDGEWQFIINTILSTFLPFLVANFFLPIGEYSKYIWLFFALSVSLGTVLTEEARKKNAPLFNQSA